MKKSKPQEPRYEVRYNTEKVEVRNDSENTVVTGYALRFNSLSRDLGGWKEIISPKALRDCRLDECIALFNHNWDQPLASVQNQSLRLYIDEGVGLRYEFTLSDTSYAQDLAKNLRSGLINESSFGFYIGENGSDWQYADGDEYMIRTITAIDMIFDVSPVTRAAYEDTTVSVAKRELRHYIDSLENNKREILDALILKQKELDLKCM